jgi:hypothetical protein
MTRTVSAWEPERPKKKPLHPSEIIRVRVAEEKLKAFELGWGGLVSDKVIGSTLVLIFANGSRVNVTMPPGSRTE